MGRGEGDSETTAISRTRSSTSASGDEAINGADASPVTVTDNFGKEIKAGSIVVDLSMPEYKGPAFKVVEISSPTGDSLIVKLGGQDAASDEWSSMLFGLREPDGTYRTNLKLIEL